MRHVYSTPRRIVSIHGRRRTVASDAALRAYSFVILSLKLGVSRASASKLSTLLRISTIKWLTPSRRVGCGTPSVLRRNAELESGRFSSRCLKTIHATTNLVDSMADTQPSHRMRHSERTRSLFCAWNWANPWQMRRTYSIQVRISSIQWPTPSRRIRGATPTALDRYPELGNGRFLGRSDGYIPF